MSAPDDELLNGTPLMEIVHGTTTLKNAAPYREIAELWARELEAERRRNQVCPVHILVPFSVTIRGRTVE